MNKLLSAMILAAVPGMLSAADAVVPKAQDPAAAARQEEAFRLAAGQRPSNWVVLAAGDLGAIFDRKDDGVQLLSLFDRAKHRQLAAQKPLPLFTVTMRNLESEGA